MPVDDFIFSFRKPLLPPILSSPPRLSPGQQGREQLRMMSLPQMERSPGYEEQVQGAKA